MRITPSARREFLLSRSRRDAHNPAIYIRFFQLFVGALLRLAPPVQFTSNFVAVLICAIPSAKVEPGLCRESLFSKFIAIHTLEFGPDLHLCGRSSAFFEICLPSRRLRVVFLDDLPNKLWKICCQMFLVIDPGAGQHDQHVPNILLCL